MANDVNRVGDISTQIRTAICKALPTPFEQHLTVMVPGKVINLDDHTIGNSETELLLPQKVELSNAILCDDMPPLANISMGPTGRSVARSYAAAISKLVPANTPVGIDDETKLTEEHKRYKKAMQVLSSDLPDSDLTLIELYTQKQKAYTDAVEDKNKAFRAALEDSIKKGGKKEKQREQYDLWVSENAKTWRARVQAAYMDWVITGKKEEVEFWFAVVDQDSALARVERSKEVMRWAVVQDSDGSCEYNKVKLEPSDWANKCKDKISLGTNQTKSVEWYDWEIQRLEKAKLFIGMLAEPENKEFAKSLVERQTSEGNTLATAEDATKTALKEYLNAKTEFEKACLARGNAECKTEENEMISKKNTLEERRKEQEKASVKNLMLEAQSATGNMMEDATKPGGFFSAQVDKFTKDIARYKTLRENLSKTTATPISAQDAFTSQIIKTAQIPDQNSPEPSSTQQSTEPNSNALPPADYFTAITVEISSQQSNQSSSTTAKSMSFGAQARYGLVSGSVSAEHSNAHTDAMNDIMESNVKISFEVMRVDINRPWLRGEIFYDEDLVAGPDIKLSPGFGALKDLIETGQEDEKEKYSSFPMYPVAFLVATNVVLEISGSTSSLHSYMNSSSTSGKASVSYGPFGSAEGSYSGSNSDQGVSCKATSAGCRIEMKAPQIIGWVSQLLPALPRLNNKAITAAA